MSPEIPHYLLFAEASAEPCAARSWRFVLQDVESQRRFSAADSEPSGCGGERMELLAVVRGLEALDHPARVTLVTKSRYVSRGIKHGLPQWRDSDWHWERFGRVVPVRDHDLWQRVDRAMRFHQVDCQAWRFENAAEWGTAEEHSAAAMPACRTTNLRSERIERRRLRRRKRAVSDPMSRWTQRWSGALSAMTRPMRQTLGAAG